jgi:hypothetical protein
MFFSKKNPIEIQEFSDFNQLTLNTMSYEQIRINRKFSD